MRKIYCLVLLTSGLVFTGCNKGHRLDEHKFRGALENAKLANEGYIRCLNFVNGWLEQRDPQSGLFPQNLKDGKDIWNAHNSAADNYPFMVLTAYLVDRGMYEGVMLDMLNSEKALTSRVASLPDEYSFSKQGFLRDSVEMGRIIFGTSEYIKDGLLPLMEYIGPSPWHDRMMEMLDDLSEQIDVIRRVDDSYFGNSVVEEINGEMLQTLSRVYWMTGDEKYLDWAEKIADYYLLGERRLLEMDHIRIRDHGCEIIGGLSEIYVTMNFVRPEKKKQYEKPYHDLLDRVLEVGRNEDGMFYDVVNPQTGEILKTRLVDNWGYVLDAYYSVYLIDGTESYRDAVMKVLNVVNEKYRNHDWENGSSDGYADAIESGINLYNREPVPSLKDWIDSEIQVMWDIQQESGIIEGWHGDGNFARTTIMYNLWKTQGTRCEPWREDLLWGATSSGDTLRVALTAGEDWSGRLRFDIPRHQVVLHLPIDYPRINQFPEWFTVEADYKYSILSNKKGNAGQYSGSEMEAGIPMAIGKEEMVYMEIVKM